MIKEVTFDFRNGKIVYLDENGNQEELDEPRLRDIYVSVIRLAGLKDADEPLAALI